MDLQWQTSSYSSDDGNCVEVAGLDARYAVRDSKDPSGAALMVTAAQWSAFTTGLRAGEFD